jgi:hypothetical protein
MRDLVSHFQLRHFIGKHNLVFLCVCMVCASGCSFTHSHTHSFTHSHTHSFTHSHTHSFTHSLTHTPTHSLTHTPTHSLTHSLARSLAFAQLSASRKCYKFGNVMVSEEVSGQGFITKGYTFPIGALGLLGFIQAVSVQG